MIAYLSAHQFLTVALTAMSWIDIPSLDMNVRSASRLMDRSFDKSDRCTKISYDQETPDPKMQESSRPL
ncbi:MAG: hypothetical protein QGH65_18855 [SAR324 cluster bacterium]|nr:hypothetical protein [SAR324 cluster bacterium]